MSQPQTFNALLVYPRFPPSYWSLQYAIELMGKRSAMPPLGLLTVAAMFPAHYRLRLVDLNVAPLTDEDLDWADLVLTSTMIVQRRSLQEVIAQCKGELTATTDAALAIRAGMPVPFRLPIARQGIGAQGIELRDGYAGQGVEDRGALGEFRILQYHGSTLPDRRLTVQVIY